MINCRAGPKQGGTAQPSDTPTHLPTQSPTRVPPTHLPTQSPTRSLLSFPGVNVPSDAYCFRFDSTGNGAKHCKQVNCSWSGTQWSWGTRVRGAGGEGGGNNNDRTGHDFGWCDPLWTGAKICPVNWTLVPESEVADQCKDATYWKYYSHKGSYGHKGSTGFKRVVVGTQYCQPGADYSRGGSLILC